jgi:hypothetical protein
VAKPTSELADELEKVEVEIDMTEEQAAALSKTLTVVPLSGSIDQLQRRLPLFIELKAKLLEAMSTSTELEERSKE